MNTKKFSDAMSEIDSKYVDEALNYKKKMKKTIILGRVPRPTYGLDVGECL